MNTPYVGAAIGCCIALLLIVGPRNARQVIDDLLDRPVKTVEKVTTPTGRELEIVHYSTTENERADARARAHEQELEVRALDRWFNMPAAKDPTWLV